MNPYALLVPLVSVLVGLAVTDVAKSLHALIRSRQRVRWDPLPLGAALVSVLAAYNVWWRLFGEGDAGVHLTFAGYLPLAAELVLLYLLCASSLPDDVPAEGLDLRAFYEAQQGVYWGLFTAYVALLLVQRLVQMPDVAVAVVVSNLVQFVAFGALVVVRHRVVHAVALALLLALMVAGWGGLRLPVL